jgi:hypothetical protein
LFAKAVEENVLKCEKIGRQGKKEGRRKKMVKEIKNRSLQQQKSHFSSTAVRTVLAICDWSAMKLQEQCYGR